MAYKLPNFKHLDYLKEANEVFINPFAGIGNRGYRKNKILTMGQTMDARILSKQAKTENLQDLTSLEQIGESNNRPKALADLKVSPFNLRPDKRMQDRQIASYSEE